jgi:hypothetical protein
MRSSFCEKSVHSYTHTVGSVEADLKRGKTQERRRAQCACCSGGAKFFADLQIADRQNVEIQIDDRQNVEIQIADRQNVEIQIVHRHPNLN